MFIINKCGMLQPWCPLLLALPRLQVRSFVRALANVACLSERHGCTNSALLKTQVEREPKCEWQNVAVERKRIVRWSKHSVLVSENVVQCDWWMRETVS